MNLQKLSRLDLNLFVALQALLEERSVTRAAKRLFITQPAMSRVLQRLRQQLDDPLFTRSGNELVATPKAQDLQLRLPAMLDSILAMISVGEFDPASYVGEITIAVPEFFAISVVSRLIELLSGVAPGVVLSISSDTDSVERELAEGILDFAIDIDKPLGTDIEATHLVNYSPSIWMREGHPLADQNSISLDEILEYPFVQYYLLIAKRVSARTDARFDKTLRRLGRKRTKALVTKQFMTALETISRSNCIMVAARYGHTIEENIYPIVRKGFPDDLPHEQTITLVLLQHKRTFESPIHRWLVNQITQVIMNKEEQDLG